MKIYTKKGDKGKTYLADGTHHSKTEEVFWVMGEVDELNSWIGLCVAKTLKPENPKTQTISNSKSQIPMELERIQTNLFSINSIFAQAKNIKFNVEKETKHLENSIDEMEKELPELKNFILPGGSEIAASLQVARAICRRVERRLVMYQHVTMIKQSLEEFVPYYNRLSDYFFVLSRFVNFKMGGKETIWKN